MTGQQKLINDIEALLEEAKAGEFGDFTNKKYPAPKMALAEMFDSLRANVVNGRYDDL